VTGVTNTDDVYEVSRELCTVEARLIETSRYVRLMVTAPPAASKPTWTADLGGRGRT
jgi:hypothetical protein